MIILSTITGTISLDTMITVGSILAASGFSYGMLSMRLKHLEQMVSVLFKRLEKQDAEHDNLSGRLQRAEDEIQLIHKAGCDRRRDTPCNVRENKSGEKG